jgi:hypothetical protein
MKTLAVLLVGCLLWLGAPSDAQAQVAYVTYYQPMTVYSPPVVYAAPQTVYYAPAPTVAYAPAPAVTYEPVARVRTRYRPLLGGTISRVRYGYAPVYYPPAPVVYAY